MRPIKRIHPTSDETPPWAGMSFTQPVDSDALHELLKNQYPQCTSLRQRKHMAAIDFLRRELESMQNDATGKTSGTPPGNQAYVALHASHPGIEELGERKHQRSISPSLSQSSSYRSPALLDHHVQQSPAIPKTGAGQQHVFSILDGLAMQPKKKRKMTPAERSAYKTTRKIGACEKCKRQKGKCTHVIETLMPMGKTQREDDGTLQSPDATLPIIIAASKDTQDLSQSTTAPCSPQWGQESQETQEGSQSEILGYVPSHITGPPHPRPLHNNQRIQWGNQSSFTGPQVFNTSFNGYRDPPDQSGDSPVFSYAPDLYEQPWNQSTGYMSEANPG